MEAMQMKWSVVKSHCTGDLWYLVTYLRTSGAVLDSWTLDKEQATRFPNYRAAVRRAKKCNDAAGYLIAGVIGWPVPAEGEGLTVHRPTNGS